MIVNSVDIYDECYTGNHWQFVNERVNFSRIYYVIGGTAYYEDDEVKLKFKPNYLYFLPADKAYSLHEEPHDKLNHMYIHAFTTPYITSLLRINCSNDPRICDIVALLRRYIHDKDSSFIEKLTQALLSYIFELSEMQSSIVVALKKYLDGNYLLPFDMREISRNIGYSYQHIVRLFKAQYQITPKQYYENKRYDYIVKCLRSGISCTELVNNLNYSSLPNFSRDFKNKYGLSPRRYINLISTDSTDNKIPADNKGCKIGADT